MLRSTCLETLLCPCLLPGKLVYSLQRLSSRSPPASRRPPLRLDRTCLSLVCSPSSSAQRRKDRLPRPLTPHAGSPVSSHRRPHGIVPSHSVGRGVRISILCPACLDPKDLLRSGAPESLLPSSLGKITFGLMTGGWIIQVSASQPRLHGRLTGSFCQIPEPGSPRITYISNSREGSASVLWALGTF